MPRNPAEQPVDPRKIKLITDLLREVSRDLFNVSNHTIESTVRIRIFEAAEKCVNQALVMQAAPSLSSSDREVRQLEKLDTVLQGMTAQIRHIVPDQALINTIVDNVSTLHALIGSLPGDSGTPDRD